MKVAPPLLATLCILCCVLPKCVERGRGTPLFIQEQGGASVYLWRESGGMHRLSMGACHR